MYVVYFSRKVTEVYPLGLIPMKINVFLLISLILISVFLGCNSHPMADPSKWEGSAIPGFPDEAPESWILAHLDVETTGLIPGYNEMIDMGWVYTSLDGEMLDTLFIRVMPQHPERTAPKAAEINGFSVEKWMSYEALSPEQAVDSLIAFHKRISSDREVLLVAFNSQFDTAFLDHLFRSAGRSWRELYFYFVLDIPSMAWGLGFKDLSTQQLMKKYQIEDEPHIADLHTGISGAKKNVRVYKALIQQLKSLQKPSVEPNS